jgi:(heptosyl)LPS beta-1,4-glucosyltransferase
VRIPRKNIIFNKWMQHTGWWPDYNIRFFKKGAITWPNKIHSQAEVHGLVIDLGPHEENALIHYNYDSISQFLRKLDAYTTITANERIIGNEQFQWTHMLEKPVHEFLSRYFARKGYKDGLHGLVLSILQGFYEFITCLKVWEQKGFHEVPAAEVVKGFEESVEESTKQLHFWTYDKKITEESAHIKKQFYKLKRKLNI